jgi:hypothetical protein
MTNENVRTVLRKSDIGILRVAYDEFDALLLIEAMELTGHRVVGIIRNQIPAGSNSFHPEESECFRVFGINHQGIRANELDDLFDSLREHVRKGSTNEQ